MCILLVFIPPTHPPIICTHFHLHSISTYAIYSGQIFRTLITNSQSVEYIISMIFIPYPRTSPGLPTTFEIIRDIFPYPKPETRRPPSLCFRSPTTPPLQPLKCQTQRSHFPCPASLPPAAGLIEIKYPLRECLNI